MVQLHGHMLPENRVEVGQVWCKIYVFSATQLEAELVANTISFRSSRLIQLLQYARDTLESRGVEQFDVFPELSMQDRSQNGCWAWQAHSFASLVAGEGTTFRPLHVAAELHGLMRMTMR